MASTRSVPCALVVRIISHNAREKASKKTTPGPALGFGCGSNSTPAAVSASSTVPSGGLPVTEYQIQAFVAASDTPLLGTG